MLEFIAYLDNKLSNNEIQLINTINDFIHNKKASIKAKELTLLTIYAIASADGNVGGGASTIIPNLLNTSEKAIIDKTKDFDNILNEMKQLTKKSIGIITIITYFIAYLDNRLHDNEINIIKKLEQLYHSF